MQTNPEPIAPADEKTLKPILLTARSLNTELFGDSSRAWPLLDDGAPPTGEQAGDSAGRRDSRYTYRLRSSVILIVQDEIARILDRRQGRFFALDVIGTQMLLAALKLGPRVMIERVAGQYGIQTIEVARDWQAVLHDLQRAGVASAIELKCTRYTVPGAFGVWLRLGLAWASLRVLGWERTLRAWRGRKRPCSMPVPVEGQRMIAVVDALVRQQASRHPLNPQCKERALVSWHLLRRMGLPARLVMGVTLYPFEAHAWTECQQQVVADGRERCQQFTPVAIYQ